ncbi:MAG: hypothetical protein WC878_04840 [Candidatus Paceibacterota bacterium]|jgi:hypothetical protein
MSYIITTIGEDLIPGNPKERFFWALAEGGTVLAFGKIPNGRALINAVGVYRSRDDGNGYQGWTYTKGHTSEKMNGFHYREWLTSEVLQLFPSIVESASFVSSELADETADIGKLEQLISLFFVSVPADKKKAN